MASGESRLDPDLVLLEVLQHHAGRADRKRCRPGADGRGELHPQLVGQAVTPAFRVEAVGVDGGRLQQLGRGQAVQLGLQPVSRQLAEQQLAGRDVAGRQGALGAPGPGGH